MVGIFLKNRLSLREYLPALQPFLPYGEQVWACELGNPFSYAGEGYEPERVGAGDTGSTLTEDNMLDGLLTNYSRLPWCPGPAPTWVMIILLSILRSPSSRVSNRSPLCALHHTEEVSWGWGGGCILCWVLLYRSR